MIIKAGVLGVTGYTGQELVRLLLNHPVFSIEALYSSSITGDYSDKVSSFIGANLPSVQLFDASLCGDLDILFLAVPHTKSMGVVRDLKHMHHDLKIIDLSADFRLNDVGVYESYYAVDHSASELISEAVYGLPELYRDDIAKATLCANPVCYATSIILGMLPLKGILDSKVPITIDAKSGVSGAGKSLKESSLFCEVHDSLSAYSTGTHRHMAEFSQEVGFESVIFSPHLIPMNRGIESAIYIYDDAMSESDLYDRYASYYAHSPFVNIYPSDTVPSTRL